MIDDSEIPIPKGSDIGGVDELVDDFHDGSVRFKFKRLKDRKPGESWICMVYGPSKTGKTYFAGTAGKNTLFINVGDGLETLMSPAFTSKYPGANEMIVVDVREADSVATAFDIITEGIDHALKHFPGRFDTIVLDEATALRKYALNKAMELNTAGRTSSTRKNRRDEYVKAEIGDYGTEMDMIEWFLGEYIPTFKRENKHFLMLAHERQVFTKPPKVGDEAVLKRVMPGFTGKTFPDKVPAFFDDVFHSEVITDAGSNASYRLRCAGNDMELGGTRHGGVFDVIEKDANFLKMLERIRAAQPLMKKR